MLAHCTRSHAQEPCLWRCSLPDSSGAPQPSLPPPLGVHVRQAPQPRDNALRSASPVKQEGLSTILHGTTTRQARHRKAGIKARQRAILAEAHAKQRFPPRSLFKVLGQANNIASALGNAQPRAKAAGTLLRRSLYGYHVHNATHALRGLTHSPPFPVKGGMAGSGHSPTNRSLSLCPRSRGVKTKAPVTTHPGNHSNTPSFLTLKVALG